MANEMDELLAELKAEYEPQKNQAKSQSTPPPKSSSPQDDAEETEFDELLADVKQEVAAEAKPNKIERSLTNQSQPSTSATETETAEPQQFYEELRQKQQAREREAARKREQQQAREREAAQKRQQEAAIAARKRAEHRELRRKAALKDKARQWLENLNPDSEEGRWFEEFAHSYDARLDAAVDYLQAMRESGL